MTHRPFLRQALILGATSLASALLAVGIYRQVTPTTTVVLREPNAAKLAALEEPRREDSFGDAVTGSSGPDFSQTAIKVTPTVVNIQALRNGDFPLDPFNVSSGSGVIISANGFIVTNHHVIEGGEEIEVTLHDMREFKARVVGVDQSTDLALLQIAASDLEYARFANSDSLHVGQWVVAVGNPFNLESTVTAGIVSAKARNINILEDAYSVESFIQTDAVINPGNSGGALVDPRGGLVGINTAIVTNTGNFEGYSFAIPSNLVLKVVRDLKEFGRVRRGILGVTVENLIQQEANKRGMKPGTGVLIKGITPGGAAEKAGLQPGDIVHAINSLRVRTVPQLLEQIARHRPGDKIELLFYRDGSPLEATVTLQELYEASASAEGLRGTLLEASGLEIRPLTKEEAKRFGQSGGVVRSVRQGSPAAMANIEPGFVIRSVNGKRVRQFDELLPLLQKGGKVVLEGNYKGYAGDYKYIFKY